MTVELDPILMPRPWGGGNPALWQLKYDVEDDRFLRIFGDIARLIRRSEKACEDATKQDNPEYQQFVVDAECDYLEELIGASFVVLQTKIRRVTSSALALRKTMLAEHCIDIPEFLNSGCIRNIGGRYKRKHSSRIELVWDVGNYYKHRDEWPIEAWQNKRPGDKEDRSLKLSRQTCRSVQRVGVVYASTGNLRTALEFFDIEPYSKCEQLAAKVQEWAVHVLELAKVRLKAEVETRHAAR